MNRTRPVIATTAGVILGCMLAAQSTAQSPAPVTDLRGAFVTLVSGEARFVQTHDSRGNGFSCYPLSPTHGLNDVQTLKFSFGQPRTGTAFGSWRLRRSLATRSGVRLICQGTFNGGSVNLTNRANPLLPARHFMLTGRVTNVDAHCFEVESSKTVIVRGRCGSSSDVTLTLLERGRVIATGTFRSNNVTCAALRPAGEVDRTLDRN
jgi:hypothetical protein